MFLRNWLQQALALLGISKSGSSTSTEVSSATATSSSIDSATLLATASSDITSSSVAPGSEPSGSSSPSLNGEQIIDNTILVIATDNYNCETVTLGLDGYGIPHECLLVPKSGASLPTLTSSDTGGNYGGIVIVGEVGYQYNDGWYSALISDQWDKLFDYQSTFGVRMVRLNVYPTTEFGVTTAIPGAGCCDGIEQSIYFTDDSGFATANIKKDAGVSTEGLWHYPAVITNETIAKEIAAFEPAGDFTETTTAAIINDFGDRKQMVFFISWAIQWSQTSNFLQHSYIHWMTRGLFLGKRKTYLSCQIDDVGLSTGIWTQDREFRTRVADMEAHVVWQKDINSRLPTGSDFWLEMAHNGNGDFINATGQSGSEAFCDPDEAVYYQYPPDTALEFKKPLGTGTNLWEPKWVSYNWTEECAELDALSSWFMVPENRDAFGHLSHTFTHQEMNNATYHDANNEITFNQAWFAQTGIDQSKHFSPHSLVPPAITGLHNGDVIRAWMENGIYYVVGDNTRAPLKNPNSGFWAYISNVEDDGYAGLVVIPRYATTIYYNCDTMNCTLTEWVVTSAGVDDVDALIKDAKLTNTRYLLGLHGDPYMFHQANMRHVDMETFTVGSITKQMSLVEIWTEVVAQEMYRLTDWPIISLTQDNIAKYFLDRQTLDECNPQLSYSQNSGVISSVTVTTNGNVCDVPVPVTVPGSASGTGAKADQVGNEPTIMWVTMSGSPATLQLGEGVNAL